MGNGYAPFAVRTSTSEYVRFITETNDVRAPDMSNLLTGLADLQSVKTIYPPYHWL